MRVFAVVFICLSLIAGIALQASAFNPQPEPPAIANKLDAVTNNLVGIRSRLGMILAHPPEPGLEHELGAMVFQLGVLYDRVDNALEPPPDDDLNGRRLGQSEPPPDDTRVLNALLGVRDQAEGIISDINNTPPPDDNREFQGVLSAAQAIVDLADEFITGGTIIVGGQ